MNSEFYYIRNVIHKNSQVKSPELTTGESKRLVQRLRNAYAENPAAGVRESWKKLGKRFG